MADQILEIKLSRYENCPWGFRLHGGADFGTALTIQKVNLKSLGEQAGLRPGDVVLAVNDISLSTCRHKEAQESIVKAGNSFVLTISRSGASTGTQWKPQVQAVGEMPAKPTQQGQTFTKTSLAAEKVRNFQRTQDYIEKALNLPAKPPSNESTNTDSKFSPYLITQLKPFKNTERSRGGLCLREDSHWDVKHNQTARGFPGPAVEQPKQNGSTVAASATSNTNSQQQQQLPFQQYNSPHNLYSEANIQEVLNQQTETLATGVKGINFKQYDESTKAESEVLKALQEQDSYQPGVAGMAALQEDRKSQQVSTGNPGGFRSVSAPVTKPRPEGQPTGPPQPTYQKYLLAKKTPSKLPPQQQPQLSAPPPPATQQDWAKTLEANTAGAATNAEDFTKQFMSQMFGGGAPGGGVQSQQQHGSAGTGRTASPAAGRTASPSAGRLASPAAPRPAAVNGTSGNDLKSRLEADKAGAADNAADFTKQFMSQMYGGASSSNGQQQAMSSPVQQTKFSQPSQVHATTTSSSQGATLSVSNSEDIVTTSQKPKKVGGSFQWPPPKEAEDQGATATPMYIDPKTGKASESQPQQQQQPVHQSYQQPQPQAPQPPQLKSNSPQQSFYQPQAKVNSSEPALPPQQPSYQSQSYIPSPTHQQEPYQPPPQVHSTYDPSPPYQQPRIQQHESNPPQLQQSQMQQSDFGAMRHQGSGYQEATRQSMTQESSSTSMMTQQFTSTSSSTTTNTQFQSQQQKQLPASILKNSLAPSVALDAAAAPAVSPAPRESPVSNTEVGPGQNMVTPRRGKGVLTQQQPGMRVPICACGACQGQIRGPFITALGRTWCPSHFTCAQPSCGQSLQEVGFVEEQGHLYCEDCYGKYLAPDCEKCKKKILGNCLKAMGKTFHPECFVCAYCGKIFANSPFYLEDGLPYCEEDWNELFTTKCVSCGFPIEAGDRWVEALNNNYHSQCFNCTLCKKNLEGKGFFVKAGKPFCKSHAKMRC